MRLLQLLAGKPVDRVPVWLMRQAGRYLPEYRALRAKAGTFLDLCQNPAQAAEVTLQPIVRYAELDAAIIFSDILVIPEAMGLGLSFQEGEGPQFAKPFSDVADLARYQKTFHIEKLAYVAEAITLTCQQRSRDIPVIGFCGSPWTVASYMIEGKSPGGFETVKRCMLNQPGVLRGLLELLVESSVAYLSMQVKAGAQCLMIFDTWGGVLAPAHFQTFSLQPMQQMVQALKQLHPSIPVIVFSKPAHASLAALSHIGADVLGVDWTMDLGEARKLTQNRVWLQGNLDPLVLTATPEVMRAEVQQVFASHGADRPFIFNLGHGLLPSFDPAQVALLLQNVVQCGRTGVSQAAVWL